MELSNLTTGVILLTLGCTPSIKNLRIKQGSENSYFLYETERNSKIREIIQTQKMPYEDVWLVDGKACHDVGLVSKIETVDVDEKRLLDLIKFSIDEKIYLIHNHTYFKKNTKFKAFAIPNKRNNDEIGYEPPSPQDIYLFSKYQKFSQNQDKELIGQVYDNEGIWDFFWNNTLTPKKELIDKVKKYKTNYIEFRKSQLKNPKPKIILRRNKKTILKQIIYSTTNKIKKEFDFEKNYQKLVNESEKIGLKLSFREYKKRIKK